MYHWRVTIMLSVCLICSGGTAWAASINPTSEQEQRREALGQTLANGKLLWVNSGKIYYSTVADFSPQLVTPSGQTESKPLWSPDGTKILFGRDTDEVWVMNADFTGRTRLMTNANTASWTRDGNYVTAIKASNPKQVIRYRLSNGNTTVIYDSSDSAYSGGFGYQTEVAQAAELRTGSRFLLAFTRDNDHNTFIVDLQDHTYIYNAQMDRGDCGPAWAPNGSYVIGTARTSSRPVVKANFNASGPSVGSSNHFVGVDDQCEGYQYYVHGERVSNDGEWVIMGGWCKQGPQSNGHREIYIWKIGEPEANAVRMTFDTNEDHSPSLYVGGVTCPDEDSDGHTTCEGDCDDSDASVHPGADEACNGVDDDCDDDTDEGCDCLDGEQQACGTDEGECTAGTQTCANGSWGACQGEVGPGPEACNGLDDNCDGNVPSNENDSDGDGHRRCQGDCDDQDASVHPDATEECNGVDDDCDDDTDEGCDCLDGEQQACGTDEGECTAGTQTCANGSWGACQGEVGPGPEACNGLDDNCDGNVPSNENDSDADGHRRCQGDCDDQDASVHPDAIEECNGVDDDCDDDTDEGCDCLDGEQQACGTDEGECTAGTRTCANGSWGACQDEVGPGPETCNGLDDNCDGNVPANEADTDGDEFRRCEGDCDDGSAMVHPGAEETCNGIDDDCDATTDEDCPCQEGEQQPCGTNEGECAEGIQTCSAGIWGACQGETGPEAEICNGKDDDCDGALPADEADADVDGVRTCEGDCDDTNANIHPGAEESCNLSDDNCDGVVDEGCPCQEDNERPCGPDQGACEPGTQRCVGGAWGACEGGVAPVDEACEDGLDNDCDGQTDEGCTGQEEDEIVIMGSCGCSAPSGGPHALFWLVSLLAAAWFGLRRRGRGT